MAYRVVRLLGRGGMGTVELAVGDDGREVALKRVALHGSADEIDRARRRFRREAEVLAALHHRAIVPLLDVVDDGNDLVLVMPYLGGGTLHDRVVRQGPLQPSEVRALGDRLLEALAAAHRQGVVHRDISPANVLFDDHGGAHLADFGVAVSRDVTVGLTATHLVMGTPMFMAPEQARGEAATPASDVFSLGATLAFAATGTGPWGTGEPMVLMHRAAAGKVERLPRTIPADVRGRIEAMLERDPDRRPTAAAARGGPDGTWPGAPAPRRSRARWWAVAATLLAVAALVAGTLAATGVLDRSDGGTASTATTTRPTTSTTSCTPLPYRPCGTTEVAANTDGTRCLDGFADFDGDAANGCEATALDDGGTLVGEARGNLVPADDVDVWDVQIADDFLDFCTNEVAVSLFAPDGTTVQVELLDGDRLLDSFVTPVGGRGRLTARDPHCTSDDTGTYQIRVSYAPGSALSDAPYDLAVDGSF